MSNLNFGSSQPATSAKKLDFWQILEQKSAFSEGTIASEVLFLNNFLNWKISAQMFFATLSPLESFLSQNYLSPIKTELDYIEQRARLISKCRQLMNELNPNSAEFEEVENVFWLLSFQLYGFGQKLIEDGKILYGLIALREAGILEKETVRERLKKIAVQNSKAASVISEFF